MTPRQAVMTSCPNCARAQDTHVSTRGDDQPGPGDVSICWDCREIAVYDEGPHGLVLRGPTADERTEIAADPEVRDAVHAAIESEYVDQALRLLHGRRDRP